MYSSSVFHFRLLLSCFARIATVPCPGLDGASAGCPGVHSGRRCGRCRSQWHAGCSGRADVVDQAQGHGSAPAGTGACQGPQRTEVANLSATSPAPAQPPTRRHAQANITTTRRCGSRSRGGIGAEEVIPACAETTPIQTTRFDAAGERRVASPSTWLTVHVATHYGAGV